MLNIPMQPPRYECGLRRYADVVIDLTRDDGTPEFLEKCAAVPAGAAATGDGGRDQCEAGDLLLMAYVRHHNGEEDHNKRELPRYIQNRFRIHGAQAEALIAEHLDAGNKARKPKAQEQDQPEAPEVA